MLLPIWNAFDNSPVLLKFTYELIPVCIKPWSDEFGNLGNGLLQNIPQTSHYLIGHGFRLFDFLYDVDIVYINIGVPTTTELIVDFD
jgi:hypothetical protein